VHAVRVVLNDFAIIPVLFTIVVLPQGLHGQRNAS
jgi:hypothetical protein